MPFLPTVDEHALSPQQAAALQGHGALSASAAALLTSPPAFEAYQSWYALRDAAVPYLGERAIALFSYAIADAVGSLACSVAFRRILVDAGDDPDHPQVTETEKLLIDWGVLIAKDPGGIPQPFSDRLEAAFSPQLRVILVALAGQTVAAAVFAAVGRVPLEAALRPYRKPGDERTVG